MSGILQYAECAICDQHFNVRDLRNHHGQRFPLVLDCGHAACEPCLRIAFVDSKAKAITCGFCEKVATYSATSKEIRSTFPLHMFLVGQFFYRASLKVSQEPGLVQPAKTKNAPASTKVKCTECETTDATWQCKQCAAPFCDKCFESVHKSAKALKSHVREALLTASLRTVSKCTKHPHRDIELFCKTCDELMCMMCSLLSHKDPHEIISFSEKNTEILPDLKSSMERGSQLRLRLKASLREAEQPGDQGVHKQLQVAERDLARHLIQLHGRMQILGVRWWSQISDKQVESVASRCAVHADLEAALEELEGALKTAQAAMQPENKSTVNLVDVKNRLDKACAAPCFVVRRDVQAEVKITHPIDILEELIQMKLPGEAEFSLVREDELPPFFATQLLPLEESDLDIGGANPESSLSGNSNKSNSLTRTRDSSLSSSTSSLHGPQIIPAGMGLQKPVKNFHLQDPYDKLTRGSSSTVRITHIKTPSDFYVQLTSNERGIEELTRRLTKDACSKKSKPVRDWEINNLYLVQYEDKQWYRGRLVKIMNGVANNPKSFEVEFIDFGDCSTVPSSHLKNLPPQYLSAPVQAIRCGLYHLNPIGNEWSGSALVKMIELIDNSTMKMHVFDVQDDKLLVDLVNTETPISLRDTMSFLGHGTLLPSRDSETIESSYAVPKFLKDASIPVDSKISVCLVHVESPSLFYVVKESNEHITNKITAGIQHYVSGATYRQNNVFNPVIGMACLAKYTDGVWYRAEILEISKSGMLNVQFVDFGNVEEIRSVFVQHIPQELLEVPSLAIACSVADVAPLGEEWTDQASELLKRRLDSNAILQIYVSAADENLLKVLLLDRDEEGDVCLNEKLVERGLGKWLTSRPILSSFSPDKPVVENGLHEHLESTGQPSISKESETLNINLNYVVPEERNQYPLTEPSTIMRSGDLELSTEETCHSEILASGCHALLPKGELEFAREQLKPNFKPKKRFSEAVISSSSEDDSQDFETIKISSSSNRQFSSRTRRTASLEKFSLGYLTESSDLSENQSVSLSDSKLSVQKQAKKHFSTDVEDKNEVERERVSVQSRLKQAQQNVPVAKSLAPCRIPVDLLHVESPGCIFVRVKYFEDKVQRLHKDMKKFYDDDELTAEQLQWVPSVKSRCAAKSVDCGWYRGIVLETLPDSKYKVMLKDLGRTEVVQRDALRQLAPAFMAVPDGAAKCHLANIKVAGSSSEWSSLACEQLNDLLKDHRSNLFISKKGQVSPEDRSLPVELYACQYVSTALEPTKKQWITINRILVDNGVALPIDWSCMSAEDTTITAMDWGILNPSDDPDATMLDTSSQSSDDSDEESLKILDWPAAEPFHTQQFLGFPTYVDHDCYVYLHDLPTSVPILEKIQKCLNRKCGKSKFGQDDYFWLPNQLCAVKYHLDQNWYRGKVLKVNGDDSIDVVLVDYGNEENCCAEELRKIVACKTIPVVARKCRIADLNPVSKDGSWSIPVLDFIHSVIVNQECLVEVIREPVPEDNVYVVDLIVNRHRNIKDILAEHHIATFVPFSSTVNVAEAPSDEEPDVLVLDSNFESGSERNFSNHPSAPSFPKTCDYSEFSTGKMKYSKDQKLEELAVQVKKESEAEQHSDNQTLSSLLELGQKVEKLGIQVKKESEAEQHSDNQTMSSFLEGSLVSNHQDVLATEKITDSNDEMLEKLSVQIKKESETVDHADIQSMPGMLEESLVRNHPGVLSPEKVICSEDKIEMEQATQVSEESHKVPVDIAGFTSPVLPVCDKWFVKVMTVLSPTEVVVLELNRQSNFQEMFSNIQSDAPKQPPLSRIVPDVPCVWLSCDGLWYRGKVKEIGKDSVQVEEVDCRQVENVSFESLRQIKEEWIQEPILGIPCILNINLPSKEFDAEDLSYQIADCLINKELDAVVVERNPVLVDLYLPDTQGTKTLAYQELIDEGIVLANF